VLVDMGKTDSSRRPVAPGRLPSRARSQRWERSGMKAVEADRLRMGQGMKTSSRASAPRAAGFHAARDAGVVSHASQPGWRRMRQERGIDQRRDAHEDAEEYPVGRGGHATAAQGKREHHDEERQRSSIPEDGGEPEHRQRDGPEEGLRGCGGHVEEGCGLGASSVRPVTSATRICRSRMTTREVKV